MTDKSRSYKVGLFQRLQDNETALLYLQAALEDSRETFLTALRNVAEARQFTAVARESELDRVNLYRMLSENGNPTLASLEKLLGALGFRLSIEQKAGEELKAAS